MASKFNIVIPVLKTCRRKISILNTKYYESLSEKFRLRKNYIIITKISKNNSNKSNNGYYIKTYILGFSYNSFQNVIRVLPTFSDWLRRLDPSLSNSVVAYRRDIFQKMASENSREALRVRNAFSYVDIGRVRGFEPKKHSEI